MAIARFEAAIANDHDRAVPRVALARTMLFRAGKPEEIGDDDAYDWYEHLKQHILEAIRHVP